MNDLIVKMSQQIDGTYTIQITKPNGWPVATESGLTFLEACKRVEEIGSGDEERN